jgi:tetratricopeptide (TPR) repeat protein
MKMVRASWILSLMLATATSVFAQLPPALQEQLAPSLEESIAMKEAYAALRAGKWDDAEKALQNALKANPDQTMAYLYLGIAYRNKSYRAQDQAGRDKLLQMAEEKFQEGLLIDPFEARIAYQLAGVQHDRARDVAEPEKRFERLEEAKQMFQKLILLSPMTRDAHWSFGEICAEQMEIRRMLGLPDEELRRKTLAIADEGLLHSKLILEIEQKYHRDKTDIGQSLTARLYRLRASLATSDEQRELDLAEAKKWEAKADLFRAQQGRGPIVK